MNNQRTALIKQQKEGKKLDFLFYWGTVTKSEEVDQSCLSDWYPKNFVIDGQQFSTVQQWMMYGKAMLFKDTLTAAKILETDDPKEALRIGKKVKGFTLAIWEKTRFDLANQGNYYKFNQNKELGDYLKSTAPKVLVLANPSDRTWGIGCTKDYPKVNLVQEWKGSNLGGFSLMSVRDHLLSQESIRLIREE